MFDPGGLLISLPARETEQIAPPSSLFGLESLVKAPLSDDLFRAVALVATACRGENTPLQFIARPEMYTAGSSLAWLRKKIGGIQNHLCISDGSTIRIVPGLRNHVFLYGLIHEKGLRAFRNLGLRCPEFLATIESQVNTFYRVRAGSEKQPDTVIIQGGPTARAVPAAWSFAWNRHDLVGLVSRIAQSPAALPGVLARGYDKLSYWPLTESGCYDKTYMKALSAAISRAMMRDDELVIIRAPGLPISERGVAQHSERLLAALAGLARSEFAIPPTTTPHVLIMIDDPPASLLRGTPARKSLFLQPNYDFWRHDLDYFALFTRKVIYAHEKTALGALWGELLGAAPDIVLERRDRPDQINLGLEL